MTYGTAVKHHKLIASKHDNKRLHEDNNCLR